jgi:hypothetical protein
VSLTLTGLAAPARPVPGLVVSAAAKATAAMIALRGDPEVAAVPVLMDMLAGVAADHHGTVVFDLAPITFDDIGTVGALDRAKQFLGARDRELIFRSPSELAAGVLTSVGLSHLVEPGGTAQR